MATVRAVPARRDRVQLLAVPLSAIAEPGPDATPADLTLLLGADGTLRCPQTGGEVSLDRSDAREVLGSIELLASRALTGPEPPLWRPGERAPDVLVELARSGVGLHRMLGPIDDPGARTLAMHVPRDWPIVPLELAYAGEAPKTGAKLCRHAADPPAGGPCTEATRGIVCPYAFWGMYRTVARVVVGRATADPVPVRYGPLRLNPVLYAAAKRADADLPSGTAADATPSALLRTALASATGTDVTRLTSWRAWRKGVRTERPQLLVALAHTETVGGEATLEIGRESTLAQPDIDRSCVVGDDGVAPLVLLMACASGVAGDRLFGALPATFAASGAGAVVATLSKLRGPDGAAAAAAVVSALAAQTTPEGTKLGAALTAARRNLVGAGLLIGLLVVALGEIDVKLTTDPDRRN
jgi:hypothetical protein